MELFEIQNLSFAYPEQEKNALADVSLVLRQGDFAVLAGPSGCGKSTLLRQLKTVLAPHGRRQGRIYYRGTELDQVEERTQAAQIGFVLQDPDSQIVTDKVWHELAFGLESLGMESSVIRGRVAEMASFFGIQTWFRMPVEQLSGGQKQLLNLASVMVMQPQILLLDEPTSQLDPIAAADFFQTLSRINRELGTTILICEHRLEEGLPLANRMLVLDGGRLIADDTPTAVFASLRQMKHPMLQSMPTPMRIWNSLNWKTDCPLTVSDGKQQLSQWAETHALLPVLPRPAVPSRARACMRLEEVWFRYDREGNDVLRGVNLELFPRQLLAVLGGNGTGKSTLLSVMAGAHKPWRGRVKTEGATIAALPQDPRVLLTKKTVREELLSAFPETTTENAEKAGRIAALCRLDGLLDRHPYDLSGGEQQRTALARILLTDPEILLLDEPTKGLDGAFKAIFAGILQELTKKNVSIVLVSHDVEFCAAYADRCGLFFDGSFVTIDAPQPFFAGKRFYTTAANRMARHLLPEAVTPEDVIAACGGEDVQFPLPEMENCLNMTPPPERTPAKRPLWRKAVALLAGIGAGVMLLSTQAGMDLSELYGNSTAWKQFGWRYGMMFLLLGVVAVCVGRRAPVREQRLMRGKLSRRTKAAVALSLLAIPATIGIGLRFGGGRRYMMTSLLVILETMLPFLLLFEGRKPRARELVILSVLSAMAIGGRAIFFALPGFKPVAAMVILTGVAFGGEAGFLVGATTMFCSNMLFGQGPWTPWQMFAMGVMGLLAGVLFRKGVLHREKMSLSIFGGLVVFIVYGGIMNPASVLMYQNTPTWKMIFTAYLTGVPADAIHALATAMFLWILSEPMLEKLDRVKVKYGLIET